MGPNSVAKVCFFFVITNQGLQSSTGIEIVKIRLGESQNPDLLLPGTGYHGRGFKNEYLVENRLHTSLLCITTYFLK